MLNYIFLDSLKNLKDLAITYSKMGSLYTGYVLPRFPWSTPQLLHSDAPALILRMLHLFIVPFGRYKI